MARTVKEARRPRSDRPADAGLVARLIEEVRARGDAAVLEMTERFDTVELEALEVPAGDVRKAYDLVAPETVEGLEFAAEQLRAFAAKQLACLRPLDCELLPGVRLGHRLMPVGSVGAYVPAGRHPLPSSALHTLIPAAVAGVPRRVACSPPSPAHGGVHPTVLVALDIAGADRIFCMGGAQAIAALAYGTESVPAVDLIVGPGNAYVTEAKRQLAGIVGIDMLAGPSELLVIADDSADPRWVAMDLLADCEHDPRASVWLVTTSERLASQVLELIQSECEMLSTGALALQSWLDNAVVILAGSLEEATAIAEEIAPEHLQLVTVRDDDLVPRLSRYGSLFLGPHSAVAFGDYVSGTDHTLPTGRSARFSSGLWVGTFLQTRAYQRVSAAGAARLAGQTARLAGEEGLVAHRRSAELRLR